MFNKQGKIWGDTTEIFTKNNVEIHRINIKKDCCCSKHKHNFKFNAFFIEKGSLKIKTWKKDYPLVDETIINAGEMTLVKPGEFHQFISLEDTIAYEIYWTEISSEDIERETCGENLGEKNG